MGGGKAGPKPAPGDNLKKLIVQSIAMLLIGTGSVLAESMKIETIPMQHRLVSDVIPIIKPLVSENGNVTGMNDKLIIKTTPSNLQLIKQVLKQIDYAPRRLVISVRQDIDGNFRIREGGLSGKYLSDNVDITVPDRSRDGIIVQGKDSEEGNVIRYRTADTQSRIEDRNSYRVQTLEGNPSYINIGQSVPIANTTTYVTPGGVVVQDGVEYHDLSSGFYVLPRLQGDNVTLAVSPYMQRITPNQGGSFDIQNLETVASGRLGEWIEVDGAAEHFNDDARENTISTKSRGQELRTILIKVEEVK